MSALSTALCPKTGLLQVLLDVAGVTLNEIARGVTDAFVKNGTLNAVAATELRKILLLHGDSRRRSISTGEGGNGQSSSRLKQSLRGGNDNRARKYSRSEQDDDFALGKGKSRLHAQMALCDCHVGRRDGGRGGRRPLPRIDHRLSSVCHDHALQVKVAGTLCHTRGRLSQGPAVGNCCTRPCAGSIRGPCADAPDPPLPAPFRCSRRSMTSCGARLGTGGRPRSSRTTDSGRRMARSPASVSPTCTVCGGLGVSGRAEGREGRGRSRGLMSQVCGLQGVCGGNGGNGDMRLSAVGSKKGRNMRMSRRHEKQRPMKREPLCFVLKTRDRDRPRPTLRRILGRTRRVTLLGKNN